jgi:hypothetical protein
LARSLNNLSLRLFELDEAVDGAVSRGEALACAHDAIRIFRRLSETQPAAYLPDLASALHNLAKHVPKEGDEPSQSEALACAREAVLIRRQLAETQPAAYESELAGSLRNLAARLSAQGDPVSHSEALSCSREAVRIYGGLYVSTPAAFESSLKFAVLHLALEANDNGRNADEEILRAFDAQALQLMRFVRSDAALANLVELLSKHA